MPNRTPPPGNALAYYASTLGDWDTISIGPFKFTGTKITLDGTPKYKFDVACAPGSDGARIAPIGYLPAPVNVRIELWTDEMMATWALLVGAYMPKPGKTKPVPVTVDHPLLRMVNLASFYVEVVPIPVALGNQTYEGRLSLIQYFATPVAQGKQSPPVAGKTVLRGDFDPKATPPAKPSSNNTGPT